MMIADSLLPELITLFILTNTEAGKSDGQNFNWKRFDEHDNYYDKDGHPRSAPEYSSEQSDGNFEKIRV
jgi:hypothetical protein